MTVRELLAVAKQQFALAVPISEASIEAQMLLMQVLTVNRAWLIAHDNETVAPDLIHRYQALCARRVAGEPIAHILGEREFFGLRLKVTPDTLIPRPDSEILVEAALEKIKRMTQLAQNDVPRGHRGQPRLNILDLGTGTGAIALAIAKQAPNMQVTAVDFSNSALAVAQENARNLNIQHIHFIQSDWFSAVHSKQFDLIVSNPPYIAATDPHLHQGDVRFEPITALASGVDGLDDIRRIVAEASKQLLPNGWLMIEHGFQQAQAVQTLMNTAGFKAVSTLQDLANHDRVTLGQWQA